MLEKLRPASSNTDHLFVGTDRYTYFSVSWDSLTKQLKTEKSYVDMADKTGRDSQCSDRCLIDPTGRFLTLELFEGILTVLPLTHINQQKGDAGYLEAGTPGEPLPVRIPELFVRSSAYLHPQIPATKREKPRVALLYEDGNEKVQVKIRSLNYAPAGNGDLASAEFEEERHLGDVDLSASHLIPVPAPACKCDMSREGT